MFRYANSCRIAEKLATLSLTMKVVSVGEITIDRYLRQGISRVGGISLNFAVHARRSGAEVVSLVSCVGDDPAGARVLSALAREGVDSSRVAVWPGRTAEIDIVVTEDGERHFPAGGYRPNVLRQLRVTDDIRRFVSRHDIAATYLGDDTPTDVLEALLPLRQGGVTVVVDFGGWSGGRRSRADYPLFDAVDLAFVSGDEATVRELAAADRRPGNLVVVTLGAAGSVALTPGGPLSRPALPVERPVDATGCGDAFQAAFTVSYYRDGDVGRALERGAGQAAGVLGHFGAFEQEDAGAAG